MSRPLIPIQAVAFDLDGLMFNTEDIYREVCGTLARRRGATIEQAVLDRMMGRPATSAIQIFLDWYQFTDTIEEIQQETEQVFLQMIPDRAEPMPGLMKLLDSLESAGIRKGIATSSRLVLVEPLLHAFELLARFDFVLTADHIEHGKPNPEIYLKAAAAFGVPPESMLVLEDSSVGCHAAVASNAFTVAVPSDHSRHQDFPAVAFHAASLNDQRIYEVIGLREA